MRKLYLIFLCGLLVSCSAKRERYIAPSNARCTTNALHHQYIAVFKNGSHKLVAHSQLSSEKDILWIEPNYMVNLPAPHSVSRFNLSEPLNDWRMIGANRLWDQGFEGQGVVVAVVDSGVDTNSPFLSNNWHVNEIEVNFGFDQKDNDQNGFVDDLLGWNFMTNSPFQNDEVNHGTQIAHLIAGSELTPGGKGVAPKVSILPVDFMDQQGGDELKAISAIEYAVSRGAKIINNSWVSPCSQLLKEKYKLWQDQGVLLIHAAGNHQTDLTNHPEHSSYFIGSSFLAVGSVDLMLVKAAFSNFGPSVQLYAPGTNIWSTSSFTENMSPLIQVAGTSYSAAIVTGAAALIWSRNPTWSNEMVKKELLQKAPILQIE